MIEVGAGPPQLDKHTPKQVYQKYEAIKTQFLKKMDGAYPP
jgi:hypothetical protein